MLWHTAGVLAAVVAVAIGYYDIYLAAIFWIVVTLILIPLRPQ
jgi:hypothetical protein